MVLEVGEGLELTQIFRCKRAASRTWIAVLQDEIICVFLKDQIDVHFNNYIVYIEGQKKKDDAIPTHRPYLLPMLPYILL